MTFKLQEFISSVNVNGIARTHSFEVNISTPEGLLALTPDVKRLITLRCNDVQLPELDMQVTSYYKKVIGPPERRVVGLNQYKVIPMEFIIDGDLKIRQFFENWMQYIVNYGDYSTYSTIGSDQLPYEISYKNEYAATIEIKVFPTGLKNGDDTDLGKIYRLYNAYPVNMGNISLNWSNYDKHMVLPMGFAYDKIQLPNMLTYMISDQDER